MSRFPAVRALLPTGGLRGDGGGVLGRVATAATGTAAAGEGHTTGQARAVYAVVAVHGGAEVPPGAEPGPARMFAGHVADTTRSAFAGIDANTPAVSAWSTAPDEAGRSRYGGFLSPRDAHPEPPVLPVRRAQPPGRHRHGHRRAPRLPPTPHRPAPVPRSPTGSRTALRSWPRTLSGGAVRPGTGVSGPRRPAAPPPSAPCRRGARGATRSPRRPSGGPGRRAGRRPAVPGRARAAGG